MLPGELPHLRRVRAQLSLSNLTARNGEVESRVQRDLRTRLVEMVMDVSLTTKREDYHTTWSVDAYVLTPDELAKLITEEAMKLYSGMLVMPASMETSSE